MTVFIVGGTFIGAVFAPAQSKTVVNNFAITVDSSQFEDNTFSNDVWRSPTFEVPNAGVLKPGEVYQANFTLDTPIKLDDGFFNGDESIKFLLKGAFAGSFDYEFLFTDVNGGPPLVNPIKGNVIRNDRDVNIDRDIDLIDGGSFTFKDIHLKLTGVQGIYSFTEISVGVDADDVEPVPEPLTILGSVAALGFGAYAERKRKPSNSSEKDNTKDS